MNPRRSTEAQQLVIMKEEVTLKRKMAEKMEVMYQNLLNQSNKMQKTMDTIATAMTGCMHMMQNTCPK